MASLSVWNGEIEPIGSLTEVWVQTTGIPPKWVDWHTLREVTSSIGLMVEVDWHSLFNSFFSLARVKVQCKNPSRIPKEIIFVFDAKLFKIAFKPQGYEFEEYPPEDGLEKGEEDIDPEEEDLLDEELKDLEKDKNSHPAEKEDSAKGSSTHGQPSGNTQGKQSIPAGSKSVKRALRFEEVFQAEQGQELECVALLKVVELEEDDISETNDSMELEGLRTNEDMSQKDTSLINLPEEWVYDMQHQNRGLFAERNDSPRPSVQLNLEQPSVEIIKSVAVNAQSSQPAAEDFDKVKQVDVCQKGKRVGKKKQWGPILPLRRSSRHVDGGRSMLDKAQDVKRKWNLEDNQGNKITSNNVSTDLLLSIAKDIGVVLQNGNSDLMQQMIEIDNTRSKASILECKHDSCRGSSDLGLGIQEHLVTAAQFNSPNEQHTRTGDVDIGTIDQEQGWSKVGSSKKNKKYKK